MIEALIGAIGVLVGVVVTNYLSRRNQKRKQLRESIAKVSGLVNDWYNQLYELHTQGLILQLKGERDEVLEAIFRYAQNRHVFPLLLENLEVIKRNPKCDHLVGLTQKFLNITTISEHSSNPISGSSSQLFQVASSEMIHDANRALMGSNMMRQTVPLKRSDVEGLINEYFTGWLVETITQVDTLLQEIKKESGRILASI